MTCAPSCCKSQRIPPQYSLCQVLALMLHRWCTVSQVNGGGALEMGGTYFHGLVSHPLYDLALEHGMVAPLAPTGKQLPELDDQSAQETSQPGNGQNSKLCSLTGDNVAAVSW